MHESLSIVRGVMKTPGDTLSAENGTDAINLMDSLGFMIEPDGWQPQLPSLKNGGVWADSAVNTGRLLVAGQDSNVTETVRLTISLGDYVSLYSMIARLQRFITDCREMWTTFYQIDPVFLAWKAIGAPDSQYALIFNIDIDIQYPDIEQSPTADITLTLEREPYWRALPPGMNPKYWAYYARNEPPPAIANLGLNSGTYDNFLYDVIQNRHEYSTTNPTSIVSRNYIDIDAADIPGDAPALVCISEEDTQGNDPNPLFIAISTKPRTLPDRNTPPPSRVAFLMFNATNGSLGTDATDAADTGAVMEAGSGNIERVNISFATVATNAQRISFQGTGLDAALARGSYLLFARARQTGGSSGDILMSLQIRLGSGADFITPEISPTVSGTTGNTADWPFSYFGLITTPVPNRVPVAAVGTGISAGQPQTDIRLYARRTTGAGVLYICDLILIPIDEACCSVHGAGAANGVIVDNTGYFSHGSQDEISGQFSSTGLGQMSIPLETRGQTPKLIPGKDNRLYFFGVWDTFAEVPNDFTIRLNIVPRWKGIRDV